MFKLNRKTEYALLALRVLRARSPHEHVRTKAIAEHYRIPVQILAKVLQALKAHGLVAATTGPTGGYRLNRPLTEISFAEVFACFTGSVGLVDCVEASGCCEQDAHCDIQTPMRILSASIFSFLENISIADLFATGFQETETLSLAR